MDSDDEYFDANPLPNRYIIRERLPLRSPLYSSKTPRNDILVKDGPLTELEYLVNIRNYIWNRRLKRVCGRDGLDWSKIGCYYFTFLFSLGALFCGLIVIYMLILNKKAPKRYGNYSALALDGGINPGRITMEVDLKRRGCFVNF